MSIQSAVSRVTLSVSIFLLFLNCPLCFMMMSRLYDCPFQVGELKRIFHSENMVVPYCIVDVIPIAV